MKKLLKNLLLLLLIFIIISVIALCAINNNIVIKEYTVENAKINTNCKILLITDLHSVIYGENQEQLIEKIDSISPDAILLGGDIVDDKRSQEGSKLLLENIGKKYTCYYVSGNHEYWSYNVTSIKNMITNYGITVLEGESVNINDNICLYGIDDPDCQDKQYGDYADWYTELYNCNNNVDINKYNILLSHRPERVEDYKSCKFDLTLCGHAHGGQWRIPYLINGIYAPNQGFFPKYAGGEYTFDNNKMIVSRGLALSNIPRIFNPPELVVINIKSK